MFNFEDILSFFYGDFEIILLGTFLLFLLFFVKLSFFYDLSSVDKVLKLVSFDFEDPLLESSLSRCFLYFAMSL
jgi:hypothetical protein